MLTSNTKMLHIIKNVTFLLRRICNLWQKHANNIKMWIIRPGLPTHLLEAEASYFKDVVNGLTNYNLCDTYSETYLFIHKNDERTKWFHLKKLCIQNVSSKWTIRKTEKHSWILNDKIIFVLCLKWHNKIIILVLSTI